MLGFNIYLRQIKSISYGKLVNYLIVVKYEPKELAVGRVA